ncbi:FxSxx-COOH system tetratricopeptide repeat protein [Streptomyces sp. NPDC048172]|uniref:FxSxx-COOH system tetratricopeptide repeat protein n=1 Tax=Streptomyces sp. NPDC048172 TaxID=3365505 RepID=UPI0037224D87
MGHGSRWALTVLATLATFGALWIGITELAAAGDEAALALASTASAAILSAGGWYAARDPQRPGPAPTPLPDRPLIQGTLPREPLAFQKREHLLKGIESTMRLRGPTPVCALVGGRGVGKTQLAGAYARARLAAGWQVVVWIVAEDHGQIVAGLDALAEAVGVKDGIQDAHLSALAARRWLERLREPALLVLDNVTSPDEVGNWLPRTGSAHTLMTSTSRSVGHLAATVDVGVFSPGEADAFLRSRGGVDGGAESEELAAELGHLPLALGQAAWLIRIQGLSVAAYRERFHRFRASQVMPRVPGEPYPAGAAEALLLAAAHAETGEGAPTTRRVVELVSLLSPSGVHRAHLHAMITDRESSEIDASIGRLTESSVVTLTLNGDAIVMHRLVQRIVRDRLLHEGRLGVRVDEAATALGRLMPDPRGGDPLRDETDQRIVDHVLALWGAAEPLDDDARRGLLSPRRAVVGLLVRHGELNRACGVGREILADHERLLSPLSDDALQALSALRDACLIADQDQQAVELSGLKVERLRSVNGPDSLHTLAAVNALGYSLEKVGRLDEALSLHAQNLADCLRVNGDFDKIALMAQINIASTLRSMGNDRQALPLFEKNLADNERTLGPDHDSTLNARGELARMYERVGRHAESLALYEVVLRDLHHRHGSPQGHELLWWGRYQALAVQGAGRTREAVEQLESLLEGGVRSLGAHHPETICVRLFLARAQLAAGRPSAALALFRQCVTDRERVLGPDNRRTLNARRNLGLAHLATGRPSRAVTCLRPLLADYERVLGPGHPYTEGARRDLDRAMSHPRPALALFPSRARGVPPGSGR